MIMTKIIYCKSLEEYIRYIVNQELVGNKERTIIKLYDRKNKIKI